MVIEWREEKTKNKRDKKKHVTAVIITPPHTKQGVSCPEIKSGEMREIPECSLGSGCYQDCTPTCTGRDTYYGYNTHYR